MVVKKSVGGKNREGAETEALFTSFYKAGKGGKPLLTGSYMRKNFLLCR